MPTANPTGPLQRAYPQRRERARRKAAKVAFRRLRDRLTLYRGLTLAALVAFLTLGAYLVWGPSSPEAIDLGTGPAGVLVSEQVEASEPLATSATEAESEAAPEATASAEPGRAAGAGEASYYGDELAGNPTASGERFDPAHMTAAHRTLPLGSRVRVTNVRNGRSVIVRINDRGPFVGHRVIDVSKAAAQKLGMLRAGRSQVKLELLQG